MTQQKPVYELESDPVNGVPFHLKVFPDSTIHIQIQANSNIICLDAYDVSQLMKVLSGLQSENESGPIKN